MRYIVTVDVPFMVEVEAKSFEEAEELGDQLIALAYGIADEELTKSQAQAWMGSRYDDTDVQEAD